MNTHTHQGRQAEIRELAQTINATNTHRMQRVEQRVNAAASVIVALVIAILGALALVHFATPCEGASLCAATVLRTRPGWLSQLRFAWRRWRLCAQVQDAERAVAHHDELANLHHEVSLIAADAAVRRLHAACAVRSRVDSRRASKRAARLRSRLALLDSRGAGGADV